MGGGNGRDVRRDAQEWGGDEMCLCIQIPARADFGEVCLHGSSREQAIYDMPALDEELLRQAML